MAAAVPLYPYNTVSKPMFVTLQAKLQIPKGRTILHSKIAAT